MQLQKVHGNLIRYVWKKQGAYFGQDGSHFHMDRASMGWYEPAT